MAKEKSKMTTTDKVVRESTETVQAPPISRAVYGEVVKCSRLCVRKEPVVPANRATNVIAEVAVGTKVKIDMERSNDSWYAVILKDKTKGFCMKKYIDVK